MTIKRSSHPFLFFSGKEKKEIISAIHRAEESCSAEIRVHLERKARENILEHAREHFEKLGMTHTEARNGVLIFLGVHSKRFCILGDKGINEKVPDDFWNEIVKKMAASFKEDRFAEGLCEAIEAVGRKLAEFFPHQPDDLNELPDQISFSL